MAYNNNSNSGYNRGYSGGGQSRPPQRSGYGAQQRTAYNQPLAEIQAEKVPDDYIDRADAIMREMSGLRPVITTSKIRNLLSLVSGIYDAERLRTEPELTKESIAGIGMMRIRTAYEAGRDPATKVFVEKAHLLQYLKGISTNRETLHLLRRFIPPWRKPLILQGFLKTEYAIWF